MPTYESTPQFRREFDRLDRRRRDAFVAMVPQFVEGVEAGAFPAKLRVKRMNRSRGSTQVVYEVTFHNNGRALWMFGGPVRSGSRHVVWLRVGGRELFDNRRNSQ